MDKNLTAFIVSTNDDVIKFNKDSLKRSGFDVIEYVHMPFPEDKLTHEVIIGQRFQELGRYVDSSDIIFIDPEFKFTPELGVILAHAYTNHVNIAYTRELTVGIDEAKTPDREFDLVMMESLHSVDSVIESDYVMYSGKYFPLVYMILNGFIENDKVLKVLVTNHDYKNDLSLWILLSLARHLLNGIKIEAYQFIDPYLDFYADKRIDLPGGNVCSPDSDKKPDENEIIHTGDLEHKPDPLWPLNEKPGEKTDPDDINEVNYVDSELH